MIRRLRSNTLASFVLLTLGAAGCNFSANRDADERRRQEERTREEAQKAAERAKPEIQAAGRALGRAAETAAEDARAAAQGIKEGWKEGGHRPLDLNSSTENELEGLPGITEGDARRILQRRPYRSKEELVRRGVLPETAYEKIREDITVK
jgi:competence protein ComEA